MVTFFYAFLAKRYIQQKRLKKRIALLTLNATILSVTDRQTTDITMPV